MNSMRFYTRDLLSKWGFGDGDMLDDLLLNNDITPNPKILIRVVREEVLPKIDQHMDLYQFSTSHNPIRAEKVNGVEVDHYNPSLSMKLTPEYVDVPDDVILEIGRDIQRASIQEADVVSTGEKLIVYTS